MITIIEYENLAKVNHKFRSELLDEFASCLTDGQFILGPRLRTFESEFSNYIGSKFCIGVSTGLDALTLALRSLNLPPGSEVIVPSVTFVATVLAVIQAGLVPVMVDPDPVSCLITPVQIEQASSTCTSAVIPVHLYGGTCDMPSIMSLAESKGWKVIEDAAQCHGGELNGKKAGSFGVGAFSFYPTKTLGALGDAGCVTTNDEEVANSIRKLRDYGRTNKYESDILGYNNRLDEIQAAFLSIKLKYLDSINSHKRKLASIYQSQLNGVTLPYDSGTHVYHVFAIRSNERDNLQRFLLEKGIQTSIHYPVPVPRQKVVTEYVWDEDDYPVADEISSTTLSLPLSYFHTEDEILKVCDCVNEFTRS